MSRSSSSLFLAALLACTVIVTAGPSAAQTRMDIYGFAMLDMGENFAQIHPDWFDTMRPTKLPSFENEFGADGNWFMGVRQTRLGFKTYTQTDMGELRTTFEFEMFGTGVDAGQTTIRLRHAYGELGQIGFGQTWSPFMDIDVFPNSIEYWGPNGMAFFRNVQARWMPIQGDTRMTIALERPGASGDPGLFTDRVELDGIIPKFPLPDVSAEYRAGHGWGYLELAGILRYIEWDDTLSDAFDLSGDAVGWGGSVSSNIKTGDRGTARLQAVVGEGVQNYMNDAPADVGVVLNPGDPVRPIEGEPLPMVGLTAFYDLNWNSRWSTSIGYSSLEIDNSDGQSANAFKQGQYALVNLLHYPAPNVMIGGEVQWGRRDNNSDGFHSDAVKVQVSARYNFSTSIGGQ